MAAILIIGLLSTVAMLTVVVHVNIGLDKADGTPAQPHKTTTFNPRPPSTTSSHHTTPNATTATLSNTTTTITTSSEASTTTSHPRKDDVIMTSTITLMTQRSSHNASSLTTVATATAVVDTGMRFDPMTATPHLQFTTGLRVQADKEDAFCTAVIALSNRRFIVTDTENRRVKVITMSEDGKREGARSIRLRTDPWDVALLPDGLVAVATDEAHWIYILNVTQSLTIHKRLRTENTYVGIAPGVQEGTLLVSSRNGYIHVISRSDGRVLKRHSLPVNFRPSYLCLAGDELIISDWARNKLFRLNVVTGEYLGELTHELLETPHQLAVDRAGNMYVAGYGSGNIMVRSPQGVWRQLLKKSHKQAPGVSVTDDGIVVLWSDVTVSADYDMRLWTIAEGYSLT